MFKKLTDNIYFSLGTISIIFLIAAGIWGVIFKNTTPKQMDSILTITNTPLMIVALITTIITIVIIAIGEKTKNKKYEPYAVFFVLICGISVMAHICSNGTAGDYAVKEYRYAIAEFKQPTDRKYQITLKNGQTKRLNVNDIEVKHVTKIGNVNKTVAYFYTPKLKPEYQKALSKSNQKTILRITGSNYDDKSSYIKIIKYQKKPTQKFN